MIARDGKVILMLRGAPGSGKHTVAQILEKDLGWKLVWHHSLDEVCRIIGDHKNGALMNEVTAPILKHLMGLGQNIVYVRPAKDRRTIELVHDLAAQSGYKFILVTLAANYETLCKRVAQREHSEFRVRDKAGLDEYLNRPNEPPINEVDSGWTINTDHHSPRSAADMIMDILEA